MEQKEKNFFIQEIDVEHICREFGTPLFVYDADHIFNQIQTFQKGFEKGDLKIKFACKSLTSLSVMKLMKSYGTGLDTVSIPEIKMGLMAGFAPDQIVFTPNCVDFSEIEQGVDLGVRINIENISNLEKFALKYGRSVPCSIRLNPHVAAQQHASKVEEWHKQSKFGISAFELETVKQIEASYNLDIQGIHIHSSSVIMSSEVFINGAPVGFDIAMGFKNVEFIDFGGGIKLDVGDGNKVIDVVDLGKKLDVKFQEFCTAYGRKLELWFEPGRYLVGNSGVLFAECVVRKTNGYKEFIGLNTGFNHLIRPMFYNAYHGIINVSNPDGDLKPYNVVGNICEIDTFAKDRVLNEVREKDLIAILSAGAYCYSMASTYNSRYRPAEVLVINGKAKLIRKRDTFEDLIRNQVEIDIS
ncbi:MAG: diaminopimelate decarboxylase [Desulfobacteraceae bacterium]|nr:diaminopimelate decarboxylase [Desulfobacteraceae bacterium]